MIAPTPGVLSRDHLTSTALLAVVHLATQPPGVLQQVTLRADKLSPYGQLLRLGETDGDEAFCWVALEHIYIVEYIGTVDMQTKIVTPFERPSADVVKIEGELADKINAAA